MTIDNNVRLAWLTSGVDVYAVQLLRYIVAHGVVPSVVICDRGSSESPHVEPLHELCRGHKIPYVELRARTFAPSLRAQANVEWRQQYDTELAQRITAHGGTAVVLAGYMRMLSPLLYDQWPLTINLHPAPPLGPCGSWQDVIWSLIAVRARVAGGMLHIVSADLDRGPVLSYYVVPIDGADLTALWATTERHMANSGLSNLRAEHGDAYPLFREIRAAQFRREGPLLVLTLRLLQEGKLVFDHAEECPVTPDGQVPGGLSLTREVEAFLIAGERGDGNPGRVT